MSACCSSCGASCAASAAICAACGTGLAGVMVAEARAAESRGPDTPKQYRTRLAVTLILLGALAIVIGVVGLTRH